MNTKVIALAKQLLGTVPKAEMADLVRVLDYYNSRFADADRIKAMEHGSREPANPALEKDIREGFVKAAGSQTMYVTSSQDVCRLCGR